MVRQGWLYPLGLGMIGVASLVMAWFLGKHRDHQGPGGGSGQAGRAPACCLPQPDQGQQTEGLVVPGPEAKPSRRLRTKLYTTEAPPERDAIFRLVQKESDPAVISRKLRPLYQRWGSSYEDLLTRLLGLGYKILPLEEFDPARVGDRIVYMRHDIHVRDIWGAHAMMDMESRLGARSTYYLLWDFQPYEEAERPNFIALRKLAGTNHRFGLHHALVEEYIYRVHAKTAETQLSMPMVKAFAKTPLFDELWNVPVLIADPVWPNTRCCPDPSRIASPEVRDMVSWCRTRLKEHLDSMAPYLGKVESLAVHGGVISDFIPEERKVRPTPPQFDFSAQALFGQEYLSSIGVRHEAYQLGGQYNLPFPSDNDLNMDHFEASLDAALKKGGAFIMLIHPWVWEAGVIQNNNGA